MNQVISAIEPLSAQEKSMLFKRMLGVWVVGILMMALLTWMFFFAGDHSEFDKPSLLLIFPLLFYGVIGFIIFSHTKNAYQKNKTVFIGIVTEKQTKANQIGKNSSVKQIFKICIEDTWFNVDANIYSKTRVGCKVKLHCLDKNVAFKIDVLKSSPIEEPRILKGDTARSKYKEIKFSLLDLMPFSAADRKRIWGELLTTIIYRVVLGLMLLAVVFFVVFLFTLLAFKDGGLSILRYGYFGLLAVLTLFYIYRNFKTFKLLRDVFDAQKYIVSEEIIDKVASTNKKPGPNSVVVINSYTPNTPQFFYLQTASFWLQVTQSEYQNAVVGDLLDVSVAKNSKTVLSKNMHSNTTSSSFIKSN